MTQEPPSARQADPDMFVSPHNGIVWRAVPNGQRSPSVPDDVQANLAHVLRLESKIVALTEARDEALLATNASVRRWIDDGATSMQVYDALTPVRSAKVEHRSYITRGLDFETWNPRVNGIARKGPCVYALLLLGTVVYIGRSSQVSVRVSAHRKTKAFDEVHVYRCDSVPETKDLEAVLIDQFQPRFNKRRERRT